MFRQLLLGYLYNIKPIRQDLQWFMHDNDIFVTGLHFGETQFISCDTPLFAGTNEQCYPIEPLWEHCDELHSCFSVDHVAKYANYLQLLEQRESFGWIGGMCILADFQLMRKWLQLEYKQILLP